MLVIKINKLATVAFFLFSGKFSFEMNLFRHYQRNRLKWVSLKTFCVLLSSEKKARSARRALWWKACKNSLHLSRVPRAPRSPEKRVKIAPDVLQATPLKFNLNGGKGRNIAQCALFFSLKWHFESGKHSNVSSLAVGPRGAIFSFPLNFLIYFSFYS